ncbi:hypothetical protein PK654_08500 [Vibrio sp. SCSIO 43137]|nr:hypothetical protein [Vibrio sp. SCSIO 43137]WCE28417.1 hypothetical protein PK654_08500 [Vibrio sp. SCSIO 43137]
MQASEAAEEYNEQMRDNNVIGLMYKNRGLNQQLASMEDAYADKKLNTRIQSAQAQSAAKAAAADAGGGGNSVDAIIGDFSTEMSRNLATIQDNLEATRAQTASQVNANQWGTGSSIKQQTQDTSVDIISPVMSAASIYASSESTLKAGTTTPKPTSTNVNTAARIGGN